MHNSPLLITAVGLLLTVLGAQLIRTHFKLKGVPGPLVAKFTNLQRVWWVRTKRSHMIHQSIHEKYGSVVRLGPNMVSISDPAAITHVYPMRPGFPKGDFYKTLMPYTRAGSSLPLVFNTRDENLHKQLKNPIASVFSLSNVLTFERFVDEVTEIFFHQLDERFSKAHRTFDFAQWLQFFAFEVMGTMTFSKRYGFLESGKDDKLMMDAIWNFMDRAAAVTQIPWLDKFLNKNPIVAMLRPTTGLPILQIAVDGISERRYVMENGGVVDEINDGDMLSRFLSVQSMNVSVPSWAVTAWTFSNIIAGSDSTATVLQTVWYNLLMNPQSQRRLYKELLDAKLTRHYPTWNEVRDLPYLDACINEAIRLHPPFCLPFERVVPAEGVTVCGHFLPGGTVVGMNPYVVNRHQQTFGVDADAWRPERWLDRGEEERRKLEQSILTFGAGRRICLGKHIAILELKKLTSALMLHYEISIVNAEKHAVENSWFFRHKGIEVVLRKRAEL